jgi:hypothetical protein
MKGLILFLGESFRSGGQGSRYIGDPSSYRGQIDACKTHVNFIKHLSDTHNIKVDVFVSTYETIHTNDLIALYKEYLIGSNILKDRVGIHSLFHESIEKITEIENYDFVLYSRIDIHLKDYFSSIFDPSWKTIHFISPLTEAIQYYSKGHPRVNDMMLFFPRKYFNCIKHFGDLDYCKTDQHSQWAIFIEKANLTYNDLDTMLNTYNDSNTTSQSNPIYYIANRYIANSDHTNGRIFDKNKWYEADVK